jgi:hypothetical protein
MNKWQPIETAPIGKNIIVFEDPIYGEQSIEIGICLTDGDGERVVYIGNKSAAAYFWVPMPEKPNALNIDTDNRTQRCVDACQGVATERLEPMILINALDGLDIAKKHHDDMQLALARCQKVITGYQMYHNPDLMEMLESIAQGHVVTNQHKPGE